MSIKQVRFMLWSGQDFGGLERRYLRIAEFLSNCEGFSLSLIYLERSAKQVKSIINLSQISDRAIGICGPFSRMFKYIFGALNLLVFLYHARSFKGSFLVFCGNPGFIAGLLSITKRRRQTLIVPNAMLYGDPPLKFLDRLGFMLMNLGGATVDHLSDEPFEFFQSVNKFGTSNIRNFKAPCSFSDYSRVERSSIRDIDVAMVARFVEDKGFDLLEVISDRLKEHNVHCCGFGPRVISVPGAHIYKTENPFEVLARTKIFLSIQRSNNYPSQSLLEAMASGCAIIATDVGETRKLLDESCAVLIPYDAKSLIDEIENLLVDSDLRIKLGREAENRVKVLHTVDAYCKYFDSFLLARTGSCT